MTPGDDDDDSEAPVDPHPETAGDISVVPTSISRMTPGETREIRVWIDGVRTLTPASVGVTFTSADISVATVSTAGVITGVAEGNTTITVAYGDSTETINVVIGG